MGRRLLMAALFCWVGAAWGVTPVPALFEQTTVYDSRGVQLPMDSPLYASDGRTTSLGEWSGRETPIVLTFNYMGCPMLCGLQQDGLARSLKAMTLRAGRDFQVVSVSIDPSESSSLAQSAASRLSSLTGSDWAVFTAPQASIDSLTSAAGFSYTYVPESSQYAHPAVTYVLTGSGVVSQFFTGIQPAPRDLNFAIVEAGQGQVGTVIDQVVLACLQYDLNANGYVAREVMRSGGYAALGGLVVFFAMLWRRERKQWR